MSRPVAIPAPVVLRIAATRQAAAMVPAPWSQRLKRVFGIDIETCLHCGGAVRILASVEEPDAIGRILEHFDKQGALPQAYYQPATRGLLPGFSRGHGKGRSGSISIFLPQVLHPAVIQKQ